MLAMKNGNNLVIMQILALTLLESCPKAGKFRLPLLRNRLRRRSPSSSSIE